MVPGIQSVAVVGGGITGLAAAHRLLELAPHLRVQLFEATARVGGVIQTDLRDGFLIERGGDMFTTAEPWGLQLCQRLGIADQLINTEPSRRRSFVVHCGRLVPIPTGFTLMSPARIWPMVTTPLLSVGGKLRVAAEPFLRARHAPADESLKSFATRRFGRQVYERLIQPLIGGIYTADPEKLSMAATMQRFRDLEARYGSVTLGLRRTRQHEGQAGRSSGARYGMFVTPRQGLGTIIDALSERLTPERLCLQTAVETIQRSANASWRLSVNQRGTTRDEQFDAVILATSAFQAARLLESLDGRLATQLESISYASVAIAVLAYRRELIGHALDGFGFVVPLIARRPIIAGSFSSIKFPGRAPAGHVLLRVFLGGACQPEIFERDDDELRQIVQQELCELLAVKGDPLFSEIIRWPRATPQYHVGHLELVSQIEQRCHRFPHFALAGNAYRGVGIPQCIRSGEQAAERIVQPAE